MLKDNKESQIAVIHGYQTILNALSKRLEKVENEKERKSITDDMISVADKIAEVHLQNQKHISKIVTKFIVASLGIATVLAAAIGVSSKFSGNELPQLDEDEFEDTEEENE